MSNGKGDVPRPMFIEKKKFQQNWEDTFGITCPDCKGKGRIDGRWCTPCDGSGKLNKKE